MTKRKKYWLGGIAAVLALAIASAVIIASILAKRLEPMIREQAIQYLRQRFHSDVELAALNVYPPKMSTLDILLRHGRRAMVTVEASGLSMRFAGARDLPPLFAVRRLEFTIDLGTLNARHKSVESVSLEGMDINVPPKGSRPDLAGASGYGPNNPVQPDVIIKDVSIRDALLVLHPREASKEPLRFAIAGLHLKSVGINTPMDYDGALTIPKPPGTLHSQGHFGPWMASEPGDTPLGGRYTFDHADLGVFNAIAGTLASTGTFEGALDSVEARGEATVPNFRLKMVGNPIPLSTRFEVLVDGTNGNTELKPVHARLGRTSFTTTGAVIKHEKNAPRDITLEVLMPKGDMRDLLRLATKEPPFMEGAVNLKAKIDIPPLSGPVREKLLLDGEFVLDDARFLRSTIQEQIDQLSRRGQGHPKSKDIDQVASNLQGSFHLENQVMTFHSLAFEVPGAAVALEGDYDLEKDAIDFRGALALDAKLSQTMSGWKRWALKPVDPFFAKHGAGTFLRIKVEGDSRKPRFGLDRKGGSAEASETATNTAGQSK